MANSNRKVCSIKGCSGNVHGHGWCTKHYLRWYTRGTTNARITPTVEERFWLNVKKTPTCWEWNGVVANNGYGHFSVRRQVSLAHRWAYEKLVGPIPEGFTIDHLCRNRICVNPTHLEPVTAAENLSRAAAARTHCKHGHPYDEVNTRFTLKGYRRCRTCERRHWQTSNNKRGERRAAVRAKKLVKPARS